MSYRREVLCFNSLTTADDATSVLWSGGVALLVRQQSTRRNGESEGKSASMSGGNRKSQAQLQPSANWVAWRAGSAGEAVSARDRRLFFYFFIFFRAESFGGTNDFIPTRRPTREKTAVLCLKTARNRGHMLRNRKPTLVWSHAPRGGALALAGCGVRSAGRSDSQGGKPRHTHMTWMAASRDMMVHSVLEDKADRVCERSARPGGTGPVGGNWSRMKG